MLCNNCGKNNATTHIKRIVNGDATEMHLCAECAAHLGYGNLFSGFGFSNMSSFFSNFLSDLSPLQVGPTLLCDKCGSSFEDIVNSGMLGCADCYSTFYDELSPSLQRIHGKTKHVGKISYIEVEDEKDAKKESKEAFKELSKLDSLKHELEKAIQDQNYEHAAELRDEIKALESGDKKDE